MTGNLPSWQRWSPRVGAIAATVTTLCCLGVSAAVSLATAIGATFMTNDEVLRPLLAITLAITVAGSVLTLRAHRNPIPLIITMVSAIWVFIAIFGSGLFAHEAHGSEGHASGHSGANVWAWSGLAVLILTQLYDLALVYRRRIKLSST